MTAKILKMADNSLLNTDTGAVTKPDGSSFDAYNSPEPAITRPTPTEGNKPGGIVYNSDGSRSVVDNYWDAHNPTTDPTYQDSINTSRKDILSRQQNEIDSINNMYANILAQANRTGQNRVNEANVINALSGQRGSASGDATVAGAETAAANEMANKLKEKQGIISGIFDKYNNELNNDIKYQNDLRRTDTQAWLNYMGNKEAQNKETLKSHFNDLISNGIKPEDVPADQWGPMAEAMGYTTDQLHTLYSTMHKKNQDAWTAAQLKALEETNKTKAETAKLNAEAEASKNKQSQDALKIKQQQDAEMLKQGFSYVATPEQRDQLKSQGYEIRTGADGRTYAKKLSEKEQLALEKTRAEITKLEAETKKIRSTKPSGVSTTAYQAIQSDVDAIRGSDGYLDTKKYQQMREHVAVQEPKALAWFDKAYPPKVVLNPNDPTAKQYFKPGIDINIGDQLNQWMNSDNQ